MAGREGKGRGGRLHATLSGGRGSVDAERETLVSAAQWDQEGSWSDGSCSYCPVRSNGERQGGWLIDALPMNA